jgi:hypothetical protein
MDMPEAEVFGRSWIVMALLIGAALGILGTVVYSHLTAPSPFMTISIAPDARSIVSDVNCSIYGDGPPIATGLIRPSSDQLPDVIRIKASFTASGGQEVDSATTYFDNTDPGIGQQGSGIFGFSAVGFSDISGIWPTGCTISATTHYGSAFNKT